MMEQFINYYENIDAFITFWLLTFALEVLFGFIAFKVVPEEKKQLVWFSGLAVFLLISVGITKVVYSFETRDQILHDLSDKQNGLVWNTKIYNNVNFEGEPIFDGRIRGIRNGLQFDWGFAAPKDNLPFDEYTAEYTTLVLFPDGEFCFVADVDDGVKLFVDENLLIDHLHGYTPRAIYRQPINLKSGEHQIKIQYYEDINASNGLFYWYELHGDPCISENEPG